MDHWFQLDSLTGARVTVLGGCTTLGFLAAHTTSIELQLLTARVVRAGGPARGGQLAGGGRRRTVTGSSVSS